MSASLRMKPRKSRWKDDGDGDFTVEKIHRNSVPHLEEFVLDLVRNRKTGKPYGPVNIPEPGSTAQPASPEAEPIEDFTESNSKPPEGKAAARQPEETSALVENPGGPKEGIVIQVGQGIAAVKAGSVTAIHPLHPDIIRQQKTSIAVGDMVVLSEKGDIVERVLPRRTFLARPDPHVPDRGRVIVANVDVAVIVVSADEPPLKPALIDRFLVAIGNGGAKPLICLNKADLIAAPEELSRVRARLAPYDSMGIPVMVVSATQGSGFRELHGKLIGKTVVFLGHSGVGKTSILKGLAPGLDVRTGRVRASDGKGRHTTTAALLHSLPDGITVIDTPGIRQFGIAGVGRNDLRRFFPEFTQPASSCRFTDCSHVHEPGCGVKAAVKEGLVSPARFSSYLRLMGGSGDDAGHDEEETEPPPGAGFICKNCSNPVGLSAPGSEHRNHCPRCLWSLHLDSRPGDRRAACGGKMEPISVWVRKNGEWAIIHRCSECGAIHSNRVAGDDNEIKLISLAVRPLSRPPFPLENLAPGSRDGNET